MTYVGNVTDRLWSLPNTHGNWTCIVFPSLHDWSPGVLYLGHLDQAGHMAFGEVFRALYVLQLFNRSGKTSTWFQRTSSHVLHPGMQVQSRTWVAQKYPSKPWESTFLGRGLHWYLKKPGENSEWHRTHCLRDKRLRRGVGENRKAPLQETDRKKQRNKQIKKNPTQT